MEMQKQVRQHKKLEKFVGTWVGPEVMHPAPWCPEGAESVGTMKCRIDLNGWFLRMNYTQKFGRKIGTKGLGMIGYNSIEKCYTFAWFDSSGGSADFGVCKGAWKGQKLSMTAESPFGHMRISYSFGRNENIKFVMELSQDGKNWTPMMTGNYTKQ